MQATKGFIQRHSLVVYFSVVLLISWGAGLIVEGPMLIRGERIPPLDALLLAQLMHFSLTGSLVVLDPAPLSPGQETLWYAVFAVVLWALVAIVVVKYRVRGRDNALC